MMTVVRDLRLFDCCGHITHITKPQQTDLLLDPEDDNGGVGLFSLIYVYSYNDFYTNGATLCRF